MVSDSEKSPISKTKEKLPQSITIPGRAEEVDMSRVKGDWSSGIRFEVTVEEIKSKIYRGLILEITRKELAFLQAGGRIFVTESDNYLLIAPEGKKVEFPY
ncbi:MAG: hypothetical protein A2383_03935 [Candidatus Pacebacteria bacterium RIFOXYB1_FULL_39_46]|nr:MAG: hypothetical protein A2182_04190 [Candidatus Pacebacteria bacterium RIFOXYA1_FULL_38_18]OGJ38561.1 MAG: hypothetical protein A2383_03935 [Candidatus Pacebacteria bacterium RIFOXYB1_FULL_39_46]OGJ40421.1 MAG: hypothetical protein A2411_04075 [Candidatus Pacebacteria bacterium RIFOXYC1_FULL_39_21]OGJ40540.1 MAG: hypothetical protein A2582_02820 [Candidatus Pacebacteria bacterium RIFOXYD1_FULL_39_27]